MRDLDHQQNIILHQVIIEKEKLEREKQKLKLLFKQKKLEANELEQKLNGLSSIVNQEKKHHENGYQSSNGIIAYLHTNFIFILKIFTYRCLAKWEFSYVPFISIKSL